MIRKSFRWPFERAQIFLCAGMDPLVSSFGPRRPLSISIGKIAAEWIGRFGFRICIEHSENLVGAQMVTQMAAKGIIKDAYKTDETICWNCSIHFIRLHVSHAVVVCRSRSASAIWLYDALSERLRRRWTDATHTVWQWRCTMHAMHEYLLFIMTQRVSRNGHVSPMKNGTTIDRHIVKWIEFVLPSHQLLCSLQQIIGFSWSCVRTTYYPWIIPRMTQFNGHSNELVDVRITVDGLGCTNNRQSRIQWANCFDNIIEMKSGTARERERERATRRSGAIYQHTFQLN